MPFAVTIVIVVVVDDDPKGRGEKALTLLDVVATSAIPDMTAFIIVIIRFLFVVRSVYLYFSTRKKDVTVREGAMNDE